MNDENMTDWDRASMAEAGRLWARSYANTSDDTEAMLMLLVPEGEKAIRNMVRSGILDGTVRKGSTKAENELVAKGKALIEEGNEKLTASRQMRQGTDYSHAESVDDPSFRVERQRSFARWANCGYPIVETAANYAAALMASDPKALAADDLQPSWPTTLIRVPSGLLDDVTRTYDRLILDSSSGRFCLMALATGPTPAVDLFREAGSLHELLRDGDREGGQGARILTMASRLVVGLLVTLQHTTHFVDRAYRARPKKSPWSRAEPAHRVAFVGNPINTDFSSYVRSYIDEHDGRQRAAPSVQTLVRGHYKRQVIGSARVDRKVIWIEPYWRGPEDAPILSRPHHVGTE